MSLVRFAETAGWASLCAAATVLVLNVPLAQADPQGMPDQYQQFVTDDGWTVGLTLTEESYRSH